MTQIILPKFYMDFSNQNRVHLGCCLMKDANIFFKCNTFIGVQIIRKVPNVKCMALFAPCGVICPSATKKYVWCNIGYTNIQWRL